MINLSFLIIIPLFFIGGIFFITSNYKLNYIPKEGENLKHIGLLEENHFVIPYVFRKYYINVINITANLFPSLLTSSFWYNISEYEKNKLKNERKEFMTDMIKKIGLFLSLIVYGLLIITWFKFNPITGDYQLLTNLGSNLYTWNLYIALGMDGISLPFILLVGFILPIVYLSNWSTIDYMEAYYILIIVLLELFLLIVFLVIDMVMFYVFFESILPPLFVLIGLYGASQKFRAGYYLFLYTLLGSLFMLLSFVKVGADSGSTFFEGFVNDNFYQLFQELVWLILFVSFSVKTPLIPVHIWLPLAHSDANVSGSIILASIVLKLALYGFIRILINIFSSGTSKLTPFFYGLCSLSVIYASSTTIRQFDLKVIVAYSSIAHMASSLLGTFSDTLSGIVGSIIFGLAHGFVSPGLFILVGAVLYDRCGSRIINYYRGLTDYLPLFALLLLLFMFANMGVPLTGNFIGEFLSLLGAYQQNIFIASISATSVVLSAVYCIYVYNKVTSGSQSPYIFTIPDMYRKEYYILLPLLVLTIILGIYPSFITSDIEFALSHCLLFAFSPVVLNNNDKNEEDSEKLHETNCNPHNTPVVDNVLPSSSNRNVNSSTRIEENITNESNSSNIGNPNSDEGNTPFVPLNDKKNKPVDANDLSNRIQDEKNNIENNVIQSESSTIETTQNDLNELNTSESNDSDSENSISNSTSDSQSSENLPSLYSESNSSINSPSQSNNSDNESESNFADDEEEEEEEDNNENNVSDPNVAQKKVYNYESDYSDSLLSDADSSLSKESFNSRNYLEKHSGRKNKENSEEDNKSERDLFESDVDNNFESTVAEGSNSRNNFESTVAEGSNSRNNREKESENKDKETIEENTESSHKEYTEENKESSNKDKGKGKEVEKYESDLDENSDSKWSASSLDSINSKNYLENHSWRKREKDLEKEEQTRIENEREQNNNNNNNNINENNNSSHNYTIFDNDHLSNLPDGNYIFITDYLFSVLNFINNNLTFDLFNVTPIHIFLLVITFISYYRYYILCISFKESFSQCFILLKFWIKNIISYLYKK